MSSEEKIPFNVLLDFSVQEYLRRTVASLPSNHELERLYPNTDDLTKKTLWIVKKRKRGISLRKTLHVFSRFAISTALIVSLLASGLMISAEVRNVVFNTILNWTDEALGINFVSAQLINELPQNYDAHYIPETFVLSAESRDSKTDFAHLYRTKNGDYISLDVRIIENSSNFWMDNEHGEYSVTSKNGQTYYLNEFLDADGKVGCNMTWASDSIEHNLVVYMGDASVAEALKIAQSVY